MRISDWSSDVCSSDLRDGIERLRNAKRYSGQHSTICVTLARAGYNVGTGNLRGPDPREMAKSDCVVIWGTNAVHTQVNVMTHAIRARKERGAKIVVVDPYRNATAEQRSEEQTSELQSLMRISYAGFCL